MADATTASLATALLGLNRKRDPLEIFNSFGKQQLAAGSSTAPLGSTNPLEGIARALQGGIGGLVQGYGLGKEEQNSKDTASFLGSLYNAKDDTERSALIQNYKGDTDIIAPIVAQMLGNKQQRELSGTRGDQFVASYGGGAAAPSQAAAAPGGITQQTLGALESGNNPRAVNPQSGAAGTYQFLPGTWADVRNANPQLNLPENVAQASPDQQAQAEQAFRAQNAKALTAAGIQPTPGNLYLAHRAGAQGAQSILQASPDTPLSTIVPPEWIQQNPDMRTTAGQFVAQANQRFPGGGQAAPGQNVGPIANGPPQQIAQGDTQPVVTPSATDGPPEIPRPKPSADQLAKYKGLIASGQMTGAQAVEALDKEVTQQWQMDKTRGIEVWKDQQQSKRQNEKAAIDLGQKAPMEFIQKTMDSYVNKTRPAAAAAVEDINALHTVRQALDAGAFTGTGANAKLSLAKLGEFFNIPSDQAVNTQVLGSAMAKRTLTAAGGTLGSGFSNADRDYVDKASAGSITLDEAAIRRLADIAERSNRQKLKQYDQEADRAKRLPGMAQLGDDQFVNPTAPTYEEFNKANPLAPVQGAVKPAQTDMPTVQTPEEARKLPSGTKFRTPNGSIGTVP